MKTIAKASKTTITGLVSVEGVRTTFEADGTTVASQAVILKLEKGLLSKRFWLPTGILNVDQINKAISKSNKEKDPVMLEMTLTDVQKIEGRFRTYAANVHSVSVPLTDDSLKALVSSQAVLNKPERPAK